MDAKYGQVSTNDVVDQLTHLNDKQKQDLMVLLKDFTRLFDATLGVCFHERFHINLVPGAQPKHSQAYAIPCIHLVAFKKELDRLVQIGVLSPQGAFSPKWEHHLKLLCTILTKLQENSFMANLLKCNWAVKETDWLRYWLMPTGLKPWEKENRCCP